MQMHLGCLSCWVSPCKPPGKAGITALSLSELPIVKITGFFLKRYLYFMKLGIILPVLPVTVKSNSKRVGMPTRCINMEVSLWETQDTTQPSDAGESTSLIH